MSLYFILIVYILNNTVSTNCIFYNHINIVLVGTERWGMQRPLMSVGFYFGRTDIVMNGH